MKRISLGAAIVCALLTPAAPAATAQPAQPSQAARSAPAGQVETVRATDLIVDLGDTRANGSVQFLRDGLRVVTGDNTAASGPSNNKAAEYWAPTSTRLPDAVSLDWTGTSPQPGSQIVFDLDADRANANSYNILVGEPVYGDDYWYTGGQARAALRGFVCPQTSGGSGSDCHGTLAEWQQTLPAAEVYAYGFSLGSGVKGQGLLRGLTADDTTYSFTSQAESRSVSPTTFSETQQVGRWAVVRFGTEAAGADEVLTERVRWVVRVDGQRAYSTRHGFDGASRFAQKFPARSGRHLVQLMVTRPGEAQTTAETVVVRTGR